MESSYSSVIDNVLKVRYVFCERLGYWSMGSRSDLEPPNWRYNRLVLHGETRILHFGDYTHTSGGQSLYCPFRCVCFLLPKR